MPTVDPDSDPVRLGDLQLAILRVLWAEGEATVARVHAVVEPERGSSASTIATMLTKMEARGFVRHRKSGRQFVYRARIGEAEAPRSMVRDVTARLFAGDPLALVSHLVREEELGLPTEPLPVTPAREPPQLEFAWQRVEVALAGCPGRGAPVHGALPKPPAARLSARLRRRSAPVPVTHERPRRVPSYRDGKRTTLGALSKGSCIGWVHRVSLLPGSP